MIFICFFEKTVDLKNDEVKFKNNPITNEEYISMIYSFIRFIDSYRFFSSSSDELVENLNEDGFVVLKKEFPDKWQYLNKKLAYPYQYFITIDDHQKPVNNLKKKTSSVN